MHIFAFSSDPLRLFSFSLRARRLILRLLTQMLLQMDPHNIEDGRKLLLVMNGSLENRLISQKNVQLLDQARRLHRLFLVCCWKF